MAAAMTITSASEPRVALTLSGTGLSASTTYIVTVTRPSGHTRLIEVTTDGAGAFSASVVPNSRGQVICSARPAAEHNGTTIAAATVSTTIP
jgi:hypothetical protein